MSKRVSTVIVILMIVTGLSLLLYPTVSDYLRNLAYRRTISSYTASLEQLDDHRYEELLAAARSYNERLVERGGFTLALSKEQWTEYIGLLEVDNSVVMGYVSVPKVNISLPIYHGTDDSVLQNGVGHLEGSSLPVGGPGTHAVLSAHTGLPSAKLFTSIDQLVEGDTFAVRVLKETLTYQVDQILVVLPYQTDALRIEPDKDYCTLVTCTPYGVNSHRLLVRGRRVPTPPEEDTSPNFAAGGPSPNNSGPFSLAAGLGLLILVVLVLAVLVIEYRQRRMWKRAKRLKKEEKSGKSKQNSPDQEDSGAAAEEVIE